MNFLLTLLVIIFFNGGEKVTKRVGDVFDVEVSISKAYEIVGINAYIEYDPSIIEYAGEYTDLGFFQNGQLLVDFLKDANDVAIPGTLVCGYVSLPITPTSGDGACFSLKFNAVAAGTTEITFDLEHLNLSDEVGDVPVDVVSDSVEVPETAVLTIKVL